MTVKQRQKYFKPEPKRVKPCPMDDYKFWSHWATEYGYEQLFNGHLDEAAKCYLKAGQMYRRGIADPSGDCFICEGYERAGEILRTLPKGAINIRRETFEESARRALSGGNKELAARLYELTALGYSLELEGYWGRFGPGISGLMLHRERASWTEESSNAGNFFETAAGLVSDPKERRRLLQNAKAVNVSMLDTGLCSDFRTETRGMSYSPAECTQAQANVDRLESILRE